MHSCNIHQPFMIIAIFCLNNCTKEPVPNCKHCKHGSPTGCCYSWLDHFPKFCDFFAIAFIISGCRCCFATVSLCQSPIMKPLFDRLLLSAHKTELLFSGDTFFVIFSNPLTKSLLTATPTVQRHIYGDVTHPHLLWINTFILNFFMHSIYQPFSPQYSHSFVQGYHKSRVHMVTSRQ